MQNAVFMRVMHSARHFGDELHRAPDQHRFASDHFVELAAFDKFHAEIALGVALADLVDGNNAWMLEACGGFCFPPKALEMCFGGPGAKADYLQRDRAIETFLMRAVHNALTAPANFFQQFVIAEVSQYPCCSPGFLNNVCSRDVIAIGVVGLCNRID